MISVQLAYGLGLIMGSCIGVGIMGLIILKTNWFEKKQEDEK